RELPGATADERSVAASGAHARACEAATWVCRQAVQLHGALGFSDEHDLGLYLNRAIVLASSLGGPEAHRRRHDALSPRVAGAPPARPAADPAAAREVPTAAPQRALAGGNSGRSAAPEFGVAQEQDWNALSDEEFRAIVRAEFEAHHPTAIRYPSRRLYWSEQSAWFERMSAKGWIAPNWPARYGGMGLGPSKLLVFGEEQERWGIARFQDQGVRMIGPALFEHGTPEQRARFLPGILSCADRYCQGYSEPGAGSDLASLRTRARLDETGEHYVVDGSKIWTTMAHDVTHMLLLARTDPDAQRQRGISFFLLELDVPGVTVRPIRDIAGHDELCEVFFDGVRIPVGNRIGPENRGWTVGKSVLSAERIHIGSPQMPAYALDRLGRVARARGVEDDPVFRSRVAALALDVAHLSDAYAGFAATFVRGEPLGPDVSLLKIWATETTQRIGELIRDTAGPAGAVVGPVDPGEDGDGDIDVLDVFYKALPSTIYGGSNEIQRSIIAKQVLGLPT
ncbi:MAG: acyl-CoA dehydrogenase family protein, partial [Pseudonocardia sediminis]